LTAKNETQYSWLDGKFIAASSADVPILTHSLQYASGVFEGLRAYNTPKGTAIFRLQDHMKRLLNSAKIYDIEIGYSEKQLCDAALQLVKKNKLESCYIRPFVFYNDHQIGLSPLGKKVSAFIAAVPFGAYFGSGKEKGVSCKISNWRRVNSSIMPPEAKASGNYANSILANMEAKKAGADEAILLSVDGFVAEGSGENIFLVKDHVLVTPSKESDILAGITRDSILKIAQATGLETEERKVHGEELYTCDELFFTGTASEVTPITSVDSKKIGQGKPGPITKTLASKYSDVVSGADPVFINWLSYV
jgi:branched-chain amino acid aminotransferase